jgi:hypothetical protein
VRVRVRIFDDDTIVTVPGCPRHAAEEIADRDFDVEDGMTSLSLNPWMGPLVRSRARGA